MDRVTLALATNTTDRLNLVAYSFFGLLSVHRMNKKNMVGAYQIHASWALLQRKKQHRRFTCFSVYELRNNLLPLD
jgi:hypothetical protein